MIDGPEDGARFAAGWRLTEAIRATLAEGPRGLAVAFWGEDAVVRLGLPNRLDGVPIACDAYSGACSPRALGELLARGAHLVDVPRLHAKVYLGASTMVAGSANASAGGLSEDRLAAHGLEAGMVVRDAAAVSAASAWLNGIVAQGRPLTTADIADIEPLWQRNRQNMALRGTLAAAILTRDPGLQDRNLRVYLYSAEEPPAGVEAHYRASAFHDAQAMQGDSYPFFWGDHSALAVDAELLCFEIDTGQVECENVWHILADLTDGPERVWPARRIQRPLGRPMGDMTIVARRTAAAIARGALIADAAPISLEAFAAAIAAPDPSHGDEAAHLARIQSAAARDAYLHLSRTMVALGYDRSYKTGRVPAVKFHDVQRRYLFAFIPNQQDLLFYIRPPALKARPTLNREAAAATGLTVTPNPSGEETIHVATLSEARRLTGWLATLAPFA